MSPKANRFSPEKVAHHAELLGNRVKKMYRHLRKRFKKEQIDCYRLYDWDIPEVRAVVDWYAGHVVVAEYVRQQTGEEWLPQMADAVAVTLDIPRDHVHIKERRTKTKEGLRYQRLANKDERFQVYERDLKFWVNLNDFLDTGLYSDHRNTRVLVRNLVEEKRFLNLYAYTGAFTIAAAAGKAQSSVTVDRSATNLEWARENFLLNHISLEQHSIVQSDVEMYLEKAAKAAEQFDVIVVDPPSFFKDVKERRSFDVNRDHVRLLQKILKVTAPGGQVFFSTNHQRFVPQLKKLSISNIKELTPQTIPEDYRNKKIHRCWQIQTGKG